MTASVSKRPKVRLRVLSKVPVLMVIVYLLAGWLTLDIQLHHDNMASLGCQSVREGSVCMVDPEVHLSWWEKTFTSTGISQEGVQLLSMIGLLSFLGFVVLAVKDAPVLTLRRPATTKDPPERRFRDFLLTFYSQGTAQPLLYA